LSCDCKYIIILRAYLKKGTPVKPTNFASTSGLSESDVRKNDDGFDKVDSKLLDRPNIIYTRWRGGDPLKAYDQHISNKGVALLYHHHVGLFLISYCGILCIFESSAIAIISCGIILNNVYVGYIFVTLIKFGNEFLLDIADYHKWSKRSFILINIWLPFLVSGAFLERSEDPHHHDIGSFLTKYSIIYNVATLFLLAVWGLIERLICSNDCIPWPKRYEDLTCQSFYKRRYVFFKKLKADGISPVTSPSSSSSSTLDANRIKTEAVWEYISTSMCKLADESEKIDKEVVIPDISKNLS